MFLPMSSAICAWAGPLNSFFRYLVHSMQFRTASLSVLMVISFLNSGLQKYKAGSIEYGIKVQFDEKTAVLLDEVEKMYQCKTIHEKFVYYWLKFTFWSYSFPLGRWMWHNFHNRLIRLITCKKRPEAAKLK